MKVQTGGEADTVSEDGVAVQQEALHWLVVAVLATIVGEQVWRQLPLQAGQEGKLVVAQLATAGPRWLMVDGGSQLELEQAVAWSGELKAKAELSLAGVMLVAQDQMPKALKVAW